MAIIREREPRLEQAIGELATEHRQLLSALDALLVESASTPVLDEVMCARVCQWINHVRQHEAREDHLVQDAFDLDIRTED